MRYMHFLLLIVLLLACSSDATYKQRIELIELASIPYRIERVISLKPSEIYGHEDVAYAEITDREDLDFIQSRLVLAHHLPGHKWWDARVVAVIRCSNNTTDTLVFGGAYQGYRNQPYKLDSLLLRQVARYLPAAHQEEIDYFIHMELPWADSPDSD